MTIGPKFAVVAAQAALAPTMDMRAARGVVTGESGLAFFDPARAIASVTSNNRVHLGVFGDLASPDGWAKAPTPVILCGERTIYRTLEGTAETGIPAGDNENGPKIEGLNHQLLRIKALLHATRRVSEDLGVEQAATPLKELRRAVTNLQANIPMQYRAVNAIVIDVLHCYSPVISRAAAAVAELLSTLAHNLAEHDVSNMNLTTLGEIEEIFDKFSYNHAIELQAQIRGEDGVETRTTEFEYRASPFLAAAGAIVLEYLAGHGQVVRHDAHGAIFALDFHPSRRALHSDQLTRAELESFLRLLGWGIMSDHAQRVEYLTTPDGTPTYVDRHKMVRETRTHIEPNIVLVRVDFSQSPLDPETAATRKY